MDINQLKKYIESNILTSSEVCELLQISRQRLSVIVKEGHFSPIKSKAQTQVFLRGEVERHFKSMKKNYSIPRFIPISDSTSTSDASLSFYENNISKLSKIDSIHIFFNSMDSVLNRFYQPSIDYKVGNLQNVDMPHFVIRDVDGKELWLKNCLCGYIGAGPRASEEIINDLIKKGKINITKNDVNKIFNDKVIQIYFNDDDTYDIFTRDFAINPFSGDSLNASIGIFDNRLILVPSIFPKRLNHDECFEISFIEKFTAFIPNPIEIICFPSTEMAKKSGYIGYEVYKFIIIDSTGRELWLNPNIDVTKLLHRQDKIKALLEACGFNFKEIETSTEFSQKISDWVNSSLRLTRPIVNPVIKYQK